MDTKPLRSKNRKAESQDYRDRAAAEIMRLDQGPPLSGIMMGTGRL